MRRLALLLAVCAAPASAQEMDLFGFNPRAVAMGGVQAAAGGDFTAVYYNPALLRGGSVGVGYTFEQPFFEQSVVGKPTFGAPSVHQLTDSEGYTFGFSVPLGGVLRNWVTLGFGGYVPSTGLYTSKLYDDGSGLYYRYENAPNQFQLFAGASVRPLPWLSFGIGAQVFGNVGGSNNFTAQLGPSSPPQPGNIQSSQLVSSTSGAAAPIAGVAVGPLWGFSLYGAWRGAASASYTEPINVALLPEGIGNLTVAVQGTYHFTPDELDFGLSWTHDRLLVAVDVDYERWSGAPPPLAVIGVGLPPELNIAYDASINEQSLCASSAGCAPGLVGFTDVVYPRVGVEYRATDRLSLRAGYFFMPSMVPHQPGPLPPTSPQANAVLLDSDSHVVSLGAGYAFPDPLKLASRLVVEAAVQVAIATPRTYYQDDAQGKLSYRTSGLVLDAPIAVRYEF